MLDRIKTLLELEDDRQDPWLEIQIENVSNALSAKIGQEVPNELNYIIEDITIRRYNRIGSEGMKAEWAGDHKVEFYDLDDEFKPYEDVINGYTKDSFSKGSVMFF